MTTTRAVARTGASQAEKTNGHAHVVPRTTYIWELLPAVLREQGSFVLYRKWSNKKVPCCPANPTKPASHADPTTWSDFELASAAFHTYPGFDGINAVCSPEFRAVRRG
jgi:primase-polymerase (primpol)-like protein